MLTEVAATQPAGEPHRRWFVDDYFDLIVWLNDDGTPSGFQLCYDRPHAERALTWTVTSGYRHNRIDDGEAEPVKNQTPIIVADGAFAAAAVLERFQAHSGEIDDNVRQFVVAKLRAYPTH